MSVTWPKFTWPKFITHKLLNLTSCNLVKAWTWMSPKSTLRVGVKGQGHQVKKKHFSGLIWPTYRLSLRSRVNWIKIKDHVGLGQRSTLKAKVKGHQVKMLFQVSFDCLTGNVRGRGSYGSGSWRQRSHGSRSKVTWVKPSLKDMVLAGGLTSTSSCFFLLIRDWSAIDPIDPF